MVGIIFLVGWLTARIFGGPGAGDFIQEIPPMRRPQAGNVAIKTAARLSWYLQRGDPALPRRHRAPLPARRGGRSWRSSPRLASRW
jgi:hypothetical protein